MDIEEVSTAVYAIPTEQALEDATQSFHTLELVVVELTLNDGTAGLGFTYTIGEGGATIATFVETTLAPLLEHTDAAPRDAYSRMRAGTTFVGREGISELAISAVDIALWDALGRQLEAPLYHLLGGTAGPVQTYETNGGWLHFSEEELVENATAVRAAGFAGMKLKLGRGHAEDAARIKAVREELSPESDLMVDANCAYSVPEAMRFAHHVRDVDLAWLEEPLPKDDYAAYASLKSSIDIPIASGENFYNPTAFTQLLAQDAIDILQPDVCRIGGITPWMHVASVAKAWGRPLSPHYIEPIHVHLACATDTVPYIEHHSTVLDRVCADPLELEDGCLRPPERPGHGLRFDGLEQYRVSR